MNNFKNILKRNIVSIAFIFIFCGLLIRNYFLKDVLFLDWDEGIYAQVASEIIKNKSLITTFNGELWLNKPPLSHALIALFLWIFGRSEFWARFPMVVLAFVLLILTYQLTKKILTTLFHDKFSKFSPFQLRLIFLTPVLVLSASHLFLERSTMLNTDILLGIAWLGYFLFKKNYIVKLLFLTLGVMSKSLLGFYPLLFELLLVDRKKISFTSVSKALVLIILPLSWHIYSFVTYGTFFIQAHIKDQVLKRVTEPIELHFGGKLFYPHLLLENISTFAFFLFSGYVIVFLLIWKDIRTKKKILKDSEVRWSFLIMLAEIPFFIFLIFVKSKISWYLTTVLPLFCMTLPLLYFQIYNKMIKTLLTLFIVSYFVVIFIPNTYLLKPQHDAPPKLQLAKCISTKPVSHVAFVVDKAERDVRNVLEAAHLYTATSFIYGGSPSFVYYVNKKVTYYYRLEDFKKNYTKYDVFVISVSDLEQSPDLLAIAQKRYANECSDTTWSVFSKKPLK